MLTNDNRFYMIPVISALCFFIVSLTGCSNFIPSKTVKTSLDIPAETFECELPTTRPSGEAIMESDVARYINSLEFSQKECRTRLKEVQVLVKCSKQPKCDPKLLIELLAVAKPKT